MVTDQEPRYRLVDADGNVVGSLFAESDGTLKLQEGTSGNNNELSFGADGTLNAEQASVGLLSFGSITEKTISGGVLDFEQDSYIRVNGEQDADDDLTTISDSQASDGDIIILTPSNNNIITVVDFTGNIRTNGNNNIALTGTVDRAVLQYDGANGLWVEISRSDA